MEKETIKLAIEGYNKEKLVLSDTLSKLRDRNETISIRFSIENRLRQIDIAISDLTKK